MSEKIQEAILCDIIRILLAQPKHKWRENPTVLSIISKQIRQYPYLMFVC